MDNHVSQKHHAGILTIRFARVDARLYQDDDTTFLADGFGRLKAVLIDNHQRQIAALRTGAEGGNLHHG